LTCFINPETSDVDTAARFDNGPLFKFKFRRSTKEELHQHLAKGREFLRTFGQQMDELERFLAPKFDLDAALEETLDVFAPQARIIRGIIRTLGNAGLGVEMTREDVAKAVYGSKSMNPCVFTEELMAAARNARRRMDERLTPLSLVIDRYSMRIDRRPETKEAD
jgi:hypothetical protein